MNQMRVGREGDRLFIKPTTERSKNNKTEQKGRQYNRGKRVRCGVG